MSNEFIFGLHATHSQLTQAPEQVLEAWIQDSKNPRLKEIVILLNEHGIAIQQSSAKALDKKSQGERHQGIVLRIKPAPHLNENDLAQILSQQEAPFLLVLDGVTDPHNLGACLRSADAAGVHAVIAPKDKSANLTPTAAKVACGAAKTTPFIQVTNLARTLRSLQEQGIWLVGTAGESQGTLYQANLTGPLAMIMGAEDKGMRRLTRDCCDVLVNIPMAGHVSSLNVSVATGVCLFEALRQRQG